MNKLNSLLSNSASYDEEISEKEKASNSLRSLPESFSVLSMIAQVQDLSMEKLIQAMYAAIWRRKILMPSADSIVLPPTAKKGQIEPETLFCVRQTRPFCTLTAIVEQIISMQDKINSMTAVTEVAEEIIREYIV